MDEHVSAVISSSGQALYALRILKSNGMSNACLQTVYQSTVVSRLTYASQAWRGFASRAALNRLDSFLRRSVKAGLYPPQSPTYEELCEALENGLFKALMGNPAHPLHHLLPPKITRLRDTRKRSHPYQLPSKGDSLHDKNFVMRISGANWGAGGRRPPKIPKFFFSLDSLIQCSIYVHAYQALVNGDPGGHRGPCPPQTMHNIFFTLSNTNH